MTDIISSVTGSGINLINITYTIDISHYSDPESDTYYSEELESNYETTSSITQSNCTGYSIRSHNSVPPISSQLKRKRCTCPPEFKILLSDLRSIKHNIEQVQFFSNGMNLGIHQMCHSDLRNFIKLSIGLLNNINADEIINHAQLTFQHCGTWEQYRNIHYT